MNLNKFKKIGIIGSGNHGRVVLDTLLDAAPLTQVVFLDEDPTKWGQLVNNFVIESGLENAQVDGIHIAIGNPLIRKKVAAQVASKNIPLISIIHPSAVIMRSAQVAAGTFVAAQSVVNSGAHIFSNVLINTAAVIEHDTKVYEYSTVCPRSCVGAVCTLNEGSFVGSGAVIEAHVELGQYSVVGMGAVVTRDVAPNSMVYGVPAKPIRKVEGTNQWKEILSGEKLGTL